MAEDPEIPDYGGEEPEQDPNDLDKLRVLVVEMAQLTLSVEELEEQLKEAKKKLEIYEENLIPELMIKLDLEDFTSKASGMKVELKEQLFASFPKDQEKRDLAFEYLRKTGNDGLIKREFVISYGRDSTEFADAFQKKLDEMEIEYEHEQTINHQSMLKFLRDELEANREVPLDKFGAFQKTRAQIKRSKR